MDIRTPIGLLFSILGAVLTIFGLATGGSEIYQRSLGTNLNLWTGACVLVFGLAMLAMAVAARKKGPSTPAGGKPEEAAKR